MSNEHSRGPGRPAAGAPPPARLAWTVWGLGACLYLIGFFQRVAPAVITGELMRDFAIGAAALGNLSAFYFYSYVAMQVPTGLLADSWGPRRLLTAGAGVAALGSALFALAPSALWAGVGRLLIGGSVAVAFVGMLKLAGHWMAPRRFALATGLALFVGVIGAVFAGVPLRAAVDAFGWRPVMLVTALAAAAICAGIWLVVRDDPAERGYRSYAPEAVTSTGGGIWRGLLAVLRIGNVGLLFVTAGGVVGPALTFAGLWGVPFLTTHYGMGPGEAAAASSTLLVAWAVGGPLAGALSDRIGRRKGPYLLGCALLVGLWALLLLGPRLPGVALWAVLVAIGLASGAMVLTFAFAKESVPASLAGTATGVVNMGAMLGPMLLQPLVGWMLDRGWDGALADGVRLYPLEAYRAGFALMVGWSALALVTVTLTRETYARPRESAAGG